MAIPVNPIVQDSTEEVEGEGFPPPPPPGVGAPPPPGVGTPGAGGFPSGATEGIKDGGSLTYGIDGTALGASDSEIKGCSTKRR